MAKEWGSARRGDDSDGSQRGPNDRVVVIENSYFEKLAGRLRQAGDGGSAGVQGGGTGAIDQKPGFTPTAEPGGGGGSGNRQPSFVVYDENGKPIV